MTAIHLSARVPMPACRSSASPREIQDTTPSPGARALALAHHIDALLESGRVASAADVANHLGITRARVSQITALLHLSARLQEELLRGQRVTSVRGVRRLLDRSAWADQEELGAASHRPRPPHDTVGFPDSYELGAAKREGW